MSAEAPILKLPFDLQREVNDHLPTIKDLLNLRLVCQHLTEAALKTQTTRMKTTYLDISPGSLRRIKVLCKSSVHAASIKNIIYLPTLGDVRQGDIDGFTTECEEALCTVLPSTFSQDLFAEIDIQQAEQAKLLELGGLGECLSRCLPLLTELKVIDVCCASLQTTYDVFGYHSLTYNKCRWWRDYLGPNYYQHCKALSVEEATKRAIHFRARFCINHNGRGRKLCEPTALVRPLASFASTFSDRNIDIEFRMPTRFQGSAWTSYLNLHANLSYDAFRCITSVCLSLDSEGGYYPPEAAEIDWAALELSPVREHVNKDPWLQFLRRLSRLECLGLQGHSFESRVVIEAVLQELTFERLRTLDITTQIIWWLDAEFYETLFDTMADEGVGGMHTTGDLMQFLVRHNATLKHLCLERASGMACVDGKPKIEAFQNLVTVIRDKMLTLRELRVVDVLSTREAMSVLPPPPPIDQDDDLFDYEAHRRREETSELGLFARSLGTAGVELDLSLDHGNMTVYQVGGYEMLVTTGEGLSPEYT